MTKKLVVFDVDGTFLDTIKFFDVVFGDYSKQQGLPHPNIEAIKQGYGSPHDHDFGWGVSREEQVRHMNGAFDLLDDYAISGEKHLTPQLFDGAAEALRHLKESGHTLAIITSKPEKPLMHALENHNIRGLFSTYRTCDDVHHRGEKEKPHPDMLHSVMRELKYSASETVMIGDSTMDIRMGRSAEANTVGVTWGAHPKQHLIEAGAHHIVETRFNDLLPTVKKIFG